MSKLNTSDFKIKKLKYYNKNKTFMINFAKRWKDKMIGK